MCQKYIPGARFHGEQATDFPLSVPLIKPGEITRAQKIVYPSSEMSP